MKSFIQSRCGLWFKPHSQGEELSGGEETYDGGSESEDALVSLTQYVQGSLLIPKIYFFIKADIQI